VKSRTIFVQNRLIPWGKYDALALIPFLFYKGEYPDHIIINHEKIHFAQQKELYIIGFFFLYLFYWFKYGYNGNPFEREAAKNQSDENYLEQRKKFEWISYLPGH